MSQKYVIVHFIDIAKVPKEFYASEWPLHVTLLANFRVAQIEKLKSALATYSQELTPFSITTNDEALFGSNKNVRVSLIQPNKSIVRLHKELLSIALQLGAIFDEPNFNGAGFRPHATIQINSKLDDKQIMKLNNLSLVDMYPNKDINRRRIITTYKLSG